MDSFTYFNFKLCFTIFFLIHSGLATAQLSPNFYSRSCPQALSTIKSVVDSVVAQERRMGASLLRLHFHDCFVNASPSHCHIRAKQGCDGSVLLDSTASITGEKSAGANINSLRGFKVVDRMKSHLEKICPGVVSCADILAVAARDSVVALGGSSWTVSLGRRDSTTASLSAANSQLPSPFANLTSLISLFSSKGLSAKDLVALSGSHTVGMARCTTFRARIYKDTNINKAFANSLKSKCPSSGGDRILSPLDTTPNAFDSSYYTNLLKQKGLLHSDQALFSGGGGFFDSQVKAYSANSASFFKDFGTAMIKMGNISPLTGTKGQIRTNCRKVNSG